VTLCGANATLGSFSYGMVLREGLNISIDNVVASAFDAGVDLRDADTEAEISNSIFFGMLEEDIGYAEEDDCEGEPECDDDDGVSEEEWFNGGDGNMFYE
jgi:hypothetical protein